MDKKMEVKYFSSPDEVRTFEKGKVELVNIGGGMVGLATFLPGWRWSLHVKPLAKTEWCEAPHFQYIISGTLHVKMADGTEMDLKPGSVTLIPPGHDGWVVGTEPVVAIDFQGMVDYAKKAESTMGSSKSK
jgi:mannose-6-phosphate isomerase-like protein (cupin superfamily)